MYIYICSLILAVSVGFFCISHALFHTQLSHTPSLTHNFVTHTPFFFVTHHLSHTTLSQTPFFFVTHHLRHTPLSHTTLHIELVLLLDPPSHPLSFLPSPFPPLTFADHYWKKLTCGVFRFLSLFTESIIILYMYKSI
jgi:hypothetical protein